MNNKNKTNDKPRKHDDEVYTFTFEVNGIKLKKKPFLKRFIGSYKAWRMHLGIFASIKAAWRISNVR